MKSDKIINQTEIIKENFLYAANERTQPIDIENRYTPFVTLYGYNSS